MAKTNDTQEQERPSVKNTFNLEDYKRKKAELEQQVESIKATLVARFTSALESAAKVQADYVAEFGERIPLPESFTLATKAPTNDKRVLGGLKHSLAVATKKGDQAKIAEVNAKIAALTTASAAN